MPPKPDRSTPTTRRVLTWLLVPVSLVGGWTDAGFAQTPDLGPAVAGGIGIRGTADATGSDVGDIGPAGLGTNTANIANATNAAAAKQKFLLPKLKNRAIPEKYPVVLQQLTPYSRALRAKGGAVTDAQLNGTIAPDPSTAALPVLTRRTIKPDDNPFGPIGYGVGGVRVLPYVEQSIGYDSNPEQISTGIKGSAFSRTEGGMALQSDWSAHELKGTLRGAYDEFFNNPRANRPDADGVVDLRIDATRDTKLDAEARFDIDTQRPGSPELNVAVRDRPLITSFGGTAGVTQAFGRYSVGLHALVDRTAYDDGVLDDGTPIDLAYQNFTDYGIKAKVGYDLKPGLQPFVEFGVDRRVHDDRIDIAGYRRDSDGIGGRVGASFEFWPQLTGLASAGYATRTYEDPRLKDLTGPTVNGSLIWAATPLTTVTLNGATSFNETTVVGSSGIESRVVGLTVSHALFRYVTLTGAVSYQVDDYEGVPIKEETLTGSLKAEYHLTRSLVLTGTLSRQRLKSTIEGSDYTQNVALIGLRLQH